MLIQHTKHLVRLSLFPYFFEQTLQNNFLTSLLYFLHTLQNTSTKENHNVLLYIYCMYYKTTDTSTLSRALYQPTPTILMTIHSHLSMHYHTICWSLTTLTELEYLSTRLPQANGSQIMFNNNKKKNVFV